MMNTLARADAQQQEAASPQVLHIGQSQRLRSSRPRQTSEPKKLEFLIVDLYGYY